MKDSPYLKECRLGDVIAAIQVLAYYKFYRLNLEDWAERITGDRSNAGSLKELLFDHPEFFQLSGDEGPQKAALVARRSFTRSYDVDLAREIPKPEVMERRDDAASWSRLSRRPLTPDETAVLIGTAVDMHSRAIEQQQASRWWVPLAGAVLGFLGGLASTVLGFVLATMGS